MGRALHETNPEAAEAIDDRQLERDVDVCSLAQFLQWRIFWEGITSNAYPEDCRVDQQVVCEKRIESNEWGSPYLNLHTVPTRGTTPGCDLSCPGHQHRLTSDRKGMATDEKRRL